MRQYLEHSKLILTDEKFSGYKPNRTGIDTISRFGYYNEYYLSEGFPLITTKDMKVKSIIYELIWFLRGESNIKYLVDKGVGIWNGNAFQHYLKKNNLREKLPTYSPEWRQAYKGFVQKIKEDSGFAEENGDLNEAYGSLWRKWETSDGEKIDQLVDLVLMLKNAPQSRRMIVTAWNPGKVNDMALPPCHVLYHLNVMDGKLDLLMYQRSCDMFLGVPFNIASYAMLTQILAQQAGLEPGRFIHTLGDAHFYCGGEERGKFYGKNLGELRKKVSQANKPEHYLEINEWIERNAPKESEGREGQDHVPAILEQLSRKPLPLPKMKISPKNLDELEYDDFMLINYQHHDQIKREMAV